MCISRAGTRIDSSAEVLCKYRYRKRFFLFFRLAKFKLKFYFEVDVRQTEEQKPHLAIAVS